MAKFQNLGGLLILPDGTEIPSGKKVTLSGDALKNEGVKQWIKDGQLVDLAKLQADEDDEGDGGNKEPSGEPSGGEPAGKKSDDK